MTFPATPEPSSRLIMHYPITAAEAWGLGAAVVLDASETLVECGTDPAAILGFAQAPAAAGDLVGDMAGLGLECPVAVAEGGRRFWMAADATLDINDVNLSCGIIALGNGTWVLDLGDTGNARMWIHKVDVDRQLALASVLAANRQALP